MRARDWGVVPTDRQRQLRGGEELGGAYDYELLDALKSIAKSAERAAAALEKLSPPGGRDREAIEAIVDERVKKMFSDFPSSSSHTRAW